MYSAHIRQILTRKRIQPGDHLSIVSGATAAEGILLPQSDLGDPNKLVLKTDSGYNLGILIRPGAAVEKTPSLRKAATLGKIRSAPVLDFDPTKPPISLVATGGTIASRVDYKTGGVYMLMDPREFLHNVPELRSIVRIQSIQRPFTIASEDMVPADHWVKIARAVHKELLTDSLGVIVTHGTDILHYTAAAMSFFLRNLNKPVILTGAQKSADRGSSDAGVNLMCSAQAALSDIAEVAVCMHGSIDDEFCYLIRGTRARKMHTVRRDAFRPINDLPIAKIYPGKNIELVNPQYQKRNTKKPVLDAVFEPKVAVVKVYPGADPAILNMLVDKKYRGFVVEGTGLGHVPTKSKLSWTGAIRTLTDSNIPVVVTSQTIYGRVNPNVYTNLRILFHESGAIPGEDMTTETAYVKLGWILAHTRALPKIREMVTTSYAGEISERSLPDTFLY